VVGVGQIDSDIEREIEIEIEEWIKGDIDRKVGGVIDGGI
jgi:hypothetical protein